MVGINGCGELMTFLGPFDAPQDNPPAVTETDGQPMIDAAAEPRVETGMRDVRRNADAEDEIDYSIYRHYLVSPTAEYRAMDFPSIREINERTEPILLGRDYFFRFGPLSPYNRFTYNTIFFDLHIDNLHPDDLTHMEELGRLLYDNPIDCFNSIYSILSRLQIIQKRIAELRAAPEPVFEEEEEN